LKRVQAKWGNEDTGRQLAIGRKAVITGMVANLNTEHGGHERIAGRTDAGYKEKRW